MNQEQERLQYLFNKYFNKTASAEERAELSDLIEKASGRKEMMQLITDTWGKYESDETVISDKKSDEILNHLLGKNYYENVIPLEPSRIIIWKRIAVAASILLAISTGVYFIFFNKPLKEEIAETAKPVDQDVQPGKDGATLTLADGTKIVLDDLQNGRITDAAVKNGNQISYANAEEIAVIQYNTMTTPKGRQFSLELADGSKVWLNAASSITYPTSFSSNERRVSITGEAYFEVAHDAKKPFHVTVNGMNVQVLGTNFNINSYSNENWITTTLLEGSIKISKEGKTQFIKPGQQIQINNPSTGSEEEIRLINNADTEAAVAWKSGHFSFKNADLRTIMRQVERWYDVEISFETGVPEVQFSGKIGRTLTLKEFLSIMDETRIHYGIEGKKLTIRP